MNGRVLMENKFITFGLFVITFGLIGIYYYYKTKKEEDGPSIEGESKNRNGLEEVRRLKEKGNKCCKADDYQRAIELYEQALAACEGQWPEERVVILRNSATALCKQKRFTEALSKINESLILRPQLSASLARRARIHDELNDLELALIDIVAANVFDCNNESENVAFLDKVLKKVTAKVVEEQLKEPKTLQSRSCIRNYLESFPNDPLLTMGDNQEIILCMKYFKEAKYQECLAEVEILLLKADLNERNIHQFYLLRGTLYSVSCREDQAVKDFKLVVSDNFAEPRVKVNALIKIAMILANSDDSSDIETIFAEAVAIDPRCPDIYYHRGLYHESTEKYNLAIKDFQEALQLHSEFAGAAAHKLFNEYLANELQLEDICKDFEDLITKYEGCFEVYEVFFKVLLDDDKFEDANRVLERLSSLQPFPDSVSLLATIIKCNQDTNSGSIILMEQIKEGSNNPDLQYYGAIQCYKSFELEAAIEYLNNAIKYAKSRKKMNDYVESCECFKAQLTVSKKYDIPMKNVVQTISKGAI